MPSRSPIDFENELSSTPASSLGGARGAGVTGAGDVENAINGLA
jgi:hypothetical protein